MVLTKKGTMIVNVYFGNVEQISSTTSYSIWIPKSTSEFHRIPWNSSWFHGIPAISLGNIREIHFVGVPWNSTKLHGIPWHSLGIYRDFFQFIGFCSTEFFKLLLAVLVKGTKHCTTANWQTSHWTLVRKLPVRSRKTVLVSFTTKRRHNLNG